MAFRAFSPSRVSAGDIRRGRPGLHWHTRSFEVAVRVSKPRSGLRNAKRNAKRNGPCKARPSNRNHDGACHHVHHDALQVANRPRRSSTALRPNDVCPTSAGAHPGICHDSGLGAAFGPGRCTLIVCESEPYNHHERKKRTAQRAAERVLGPAPVPKSHSAMPDSNPTPFSNQACDPDTPSPEAR